MKWLFFCILTLPCTFLKGQSGNYFLSHFQFGDDIEENVCFDILQAENGLMYFATNRGIVQFDGMEYELIPSPSPIYSLRSFKGEIYWGGIGGFGKVIAGASKQLYSLTKDETDVFQLGVGADRIFALSDRKFFMYTGKNLYSIPVQKAYGSYTGMVEYANTVLVNTENRGYYKFVHDHLDPFMFRFKDTEILFSNAYDRQVLMGLSDSSLYVIDATKKWRKIKAEDKAYLNSNVVVSGAWVNKECIVLGTLRGGLVFLNPTTGATIEIVNYSTGLPDNEVYAILRDYQSGIWAAHAYGFTRISPHLPFKSFHHYPGLKGRILCAITHQNKIYVGTSLGLFLLEKEEVYQELDYFETVKIREKVKISEQPADVKKNESSAKIEVAPISEIPPVESKKKGLLHFLKRKRTTTNSESGPVTQPARNDSTPAVIENKIPKVRYVDRIAYKNEKKKKQVLLTSYYVFKPVADIHAKVSQLNSWNNYLIASGTGGVHLVDGQTVFLITTEPSRCLLPFKNRIFIASSYRPRVMSFSLRGTSWLEDEDLQGVQEDIQSMFPGNDSTLWLCAQDNVYKVHYAKDNAFHIAVCPLPQMQYEQYLGYQHGGDVYLAGSTGILKYDESLNRFRVEVDNAGFKQYFVFKNELWYRDAHGWSQHLKGNEPASIGHLNLFENIKSISGESDGNDLWIITAENELYKFYGERFVPYTSSFPLQLKSLKNRENYIHNLNQLTFEEGNHSLAFEFMVPDYLSPRGYEFRYQLKGLDTGWSEWTSNGNRLDFPYLPPGEYELKVQSKDIFGRTQQIRPIAFDVVPPFWQRTWFYLLEFIVFAALVVLSFRISRRNRFLSRLLSFLTIIMLIQFIQTVVGEVFGTRSSPVIDFFVQVTVAFLILPLEAFLRRWMLKTKEFDPFHGKTLPPREKQVEIKAENTSTP